jgi:hypothetical protein
MQSSSNLQSYSFIPTFLKVAKIPWFSHFAHLPTDIAFVNMVGSSIGITFGTLAVGFTANVADPIGIFAPVDGIKVGPILGAIYFSGPVSFASHN